MANKANVWSRRRFLETIGLGAAASALLPYVPTLGEAHAADVFPKRLFILNTPNGFSSIADWRPTGGETSFTLSPILQPLNVHKSKIIVLDGIDNEARYRPSVGNHYASACLWTGIGPQVINSSENIHSGYARGPSIDQIVAKGLAADTKRASVQLGVRINRPDYLHARYYSAGNNQPLYTENDPVKAFELLFGQGTTDNSATLASLKRREQSVLSAVRGDVHALEKQLRGGDLERLQSHLAGIETLEKQLDTAYQPVACTPPPQPPGNLGTGYSTNIAESTVWQMRLGVQALACGVTNVVSLAMGHGGHTGRQTHLTGHTDDIHVYSHGGTGTTDRARFRQYNTWCMTKLAELISMLDAIPEGTGTLLDNTVVVYASEIGYSDPHHNRNIPVIIAGGKNCGLRTGRYLRFGSYQQANEQAHGGQPMNRVLVSVCHAMGLKSVNYVGDPSIPQGPLPGLELA